MSILLHNTLGQCRTNTQGRCLAMTEVPGEKTTNNIWRELGKPGSFCSWPCIDVSLHLLPSISNWTGTRPLALIRTCAADVLSYTKLRRGQRREGGSADSQTYPRHTQVWPTCNITVKILHLLQGKTYDALGYYTSHTFRAPSSSSSNCNFLAQPKVNRPQNAVPFF